MTKSIKQGLRKQSEALVFIPVIYQYVKFAGFENS